jgi:antitoxin (DNA-binding transcriptional repressor) of toxin-antitoxin stability system
MRCISLFFAVLIVLPLAAQNPNDPRSGHDRSALATVLHDTLVYEAADDTSQRVTEVLPGHEVVIVEHNGPWVKVFANTDKPDRIDDAETPEFGPDAPTPQSGWIKDKGLVSSATPDGDAILIGSAADLEDAASRPHAPTYAATSAHLLYARVVDYFPQSRLAAEAAYRSADIRWQLTKLDNASLPSAHEQEAYLRPQLYEGDLKRVIKFYPQTDYAALAAWDLLDNKLCGDWQGLPKCPEMEAHLYLKYAQNWQASSKAAEATYNAVYRFGVLVSMYLVDNSQGSSKTAAKDAEKVTADMRTRFPDSDFTRRAQSIVFRVQQGVPIFGSDRE